MREVSGEGLFGALRLRLYETDKNEETQSEARFQSRKSEQGRMRLVPGIILNGEPGASALRQIRTRLPVPQVL